MPKQLKLKSENEGNLLTRPRDKKHPEGYVAVFRERSDGDWDFVAMMALEEDGPFPQMSQADEDAALALLTKIGEAIGEEGDRALILYLGDPDCPSIYEMQVDEDGVAEIPDPEPAEKK